MNTPLRVLLVGDATTANLAAVLRADRAQPPIDVAEAEFSAALPTLLNPSAKGWSHKPDLTFVWTRPDAVLPTFADAAAGERVAPDAVDADVDRFADAVAAAADRSRWTAVASWTVPFGQRGLGVLDLHDPAGTRALLARANARLLERLRAVPQVWVLDAANWVDAQRGDRKLWYAAKVAVPMPALRLIARDLRSFLNAATGRARKLVILDLDNTLWGGIVGENGWQGLRLGGHDPVGEAFVDFQRALKTLTRRGVVLAICSKNEESVALEAIRQHPEMVLRESDFAGWRINWRDKAQNVAELLAELRLGSDAAVFLDDQPAERARVQAEHPQMLVPEWPADGLSSVDLLDRLACFDLLGLSDEDRARAASYAAERQRRELQTEVGDAGDWLAQLGVRVQLSRLNEADLPRTAQLLNKTNQMNLRTRRLSEAELAQWAAGSQRSLLTCRVADRFSDFGLTGIVSIEVRDGTAHVEDFLLSCRVMTRKVEEVLLRAAALEARRLGARELVVEGIPTPRNAPMLAYMREAGMEGAGGKYVYRLRTTQEPPVPAGVLILGPDT